MKRMIALTLTICLILGCAGCAKKSTDNSTPSEAEQNSEGQQQVEKVQTDFSEQKMTDLYNGQGEYQDQPIVIMQTSQGDIKLRLFPQVAPKAVENFVTHAKEGYYDNLSFHRVVNDFMIQGGDPKGTGAGGESIWNTPFEDEFSDMAHNFRGALSMANAGYGTNGSQFFIVQSKTAFKTEEEKQDILLTMYMNREIYEGTMKLQAAKEGKTSIKQLKELMNTLNSELAEKEKNGVPEEFAKKMEPVMQKYATEGGTPFLDYKHTVFGYVIEGMDVVDKIAALEEKDKNGQGTQKPTEEVIVTKVIVEE